MFSAEFSHRRFELLSLVDFSWVSIDQEALGIGVGQHLVPDHGEDGFERNELASLHDFLKLLASFGSRSDFSAEKIARRKVAVAVLGDG